MLDREHASVVHKLIKGRHKGGSNDWSAVSVHHDPPLCHPLPYTLLTHRLPLLTRRLDNVYFYRYFKNSDKAERMKLSIKA